MIARPDSRLERMYDTPYDGSPAASLSMNTLTIVLVRTAPTTVTSTPKDKKAMTMILRLRGIFRSCSIHEGMSRMRTSVARTIDDVLTVYAPGWMQCPCTLGSQFLAMGLHWKMQVRGAAIAKQPFSVSVPQRQPLIHLFCDRSLMSVMRKETLTSARIGL